ncbi:MAG: sulfatase-like hydrolase/transferase [Candidatus Hydrogenedentes bacterium]|nr:sulfatase-like hydrolase/transferase [Candidatus Hydrogenedentota bacterium]
MAKKLVLFVVKASIAAGLFALLFFPDWFGLPADKFQRVTPGDMLAEVRDAGAPSLAFWLTAAVLVRVTGMLCGVLRWRILLRGQGLHIPFWYMVGSWFIGRTFGIFLPGTIGLDGYRLYDSALYTGEVIKCTTVIAIEKLIGFIALTFLVFVTFPMGFKLLSFSIPMLAATLIVLGGFVAVSFITLLNPRVIQIVVMALPTPGFIRTKVNKLGASITAYSGKRSDLLLAVFFGFIVHAATALMYFCTMMAIRTEHTSIFDVLFASPLVIYSTVLAPTVGGLGAREIVGVALLGGQSGAAAALTFFHLGWWVGDVTPYLIGLPILAFRSRPTAAQVQAKLAELRLSAAGEETLLELSHDEISGYRNKLANYVLAGIAGGVFAGCLAGFAEAGWLISNAANLKEAVAYWWGPLVYGMCFIGVGLGIAAGLTFIALVLDRFLKSQSVFGLCLGGSVAAATLIVGGFRFFQDVNAEHMLSAKQLAMLGGAALALGIGFCIVGFLVVAFTKSSRRTAISATAAGYAAFLFLGLAVASINKTDAKATDFAPVAGANGPNIIFIAVDTLRADYLKAYDASARAITPAIDALRKDSVLFTDCYAQSSWTKASFATIFSGKYPETHGAYEKSAMLSDETVTFPEVLRDVGYYTQGYCNNPNIADTYNYGQGYVEYDYLRPRYVLFANQSAEKMVLYKVVRQVWSKVVGKLTGGKINIRDFYQPAEVVTKTATEWLDGEQRPKDAPFFLFLHYMDPHDPYMDRTQPGVGYARVRMGTDIDPVEWKEKLQSAYIGEIEYCDKYIGDLIEGLKQRGLYDDSLIVFTADHGEEFHEHGGWWHGLSLYDEQIGVPLMFKLPKNQLAGAESKFLARHVDVGPTILQMANADPKRIADAKMQGEPLFAKEISADFRDVSGGYIYSHLNFEGIELRALRTPLYKLIHSNENKRKFPPVELYNVANDPGEQKNLAGSGDAEEQKLGETLEAMRKYAAENAQKPEYAISAEQEEALKALGYTGP